MTTREERERLRELAAKATPRPWGLCNDGKCSCKSIDAEHHPIAKVIHGDWGDDYPTIELTGPSIDITARAVMKQITYGNIPEAIATINGQYLVAAANIAPALCDDIEALEVTISALKTQVANLNQQPDDLLIRLMAAQNELAALKEVNRWIPVSEKMPRDRDQVDFAGKYFDTKVVFCGAHYKDGWYANGTVISVVDVTHWRPRPAPPEVGK